jgi:hypothetical protein
VRCSAHESDLWCVLQADNHRIYHPTCSLWVLKKLNVDISNHHHCWPPVAPARGEEKVHAPVSESDWKQNC